MDNKKKPINKRLKKLYNSIQYEEPDRAQKDDDKVTGGGRIVQSNAQVPETVR
jgi:hypothetical protein